LVASAWQGWLLPARWFEPEPVSATRMRLRSPYTSARLYETRLADAARRGYLALSGEGEGEYRLTEAGRQAAERVLAAMHVAMAALHPLPAAELERLAAILHRLVLSSLATQEPPGKWSLRFSCRIDPKDDAPVVVRIDQYGGDLAAYRDDAHLAAWQPLLDDGHTWDVLTCLWRAEAGTLAELHDRLQRRGYCLDEDRQALNDLIGRGWVREDSGRCHVTAPGQEIRQAPSFGMLPTSWRC
jgi:hypothetical protein